MFDLLRRGIGLPGRDSGGLVDAGDILYGTAAQRPTAGPAWLDKLYFASDTNGGTLYHCQKPLASGFTWTKVAQGVTEAVGTGSETFKTLVDIAFGTAVFNTTSETPFACTYDIPANTLAIGDMIAIEMWGTYSLDTIAPTLIARVKFDTTVMVATGTINTLVGTASNRQWAGRASIQIGSIGGSGASNGQGEFSFATATGAKVFAEAPNTGNTTIDTTQALTVSSTMQWGTASANNTISLSQMTVHIQNGA